MLRPSDAHCMASFIPVRKQLGAWLQAGADDSSTSTQPSPAPSTSLNQASGPASDQADGARSPEPVSEPFGNELRPSASPAQPNASREPHTRSSVPLSARIAGSPVAQASITSTAAVSEAAAGFPVRSALAASELMTSHGQLLTPQKAKAKPDAANENVQPKMQLQPHSISLATQEAQMMLPDVQRVQEAAQASPAASVAASSSSEDFGIPPEPTRLAPLPALEPATGRVPLHLPALHSSTRRSSPMSRQHDGNLPHIHIQADLANLGHGHAASGSEHPSDGDDDGYLEDGAQSHEDYEDLHNSGQPGNLRGSTPAKLRWSTSSASSSGASMLDEPLRSAQHGPDQAQAGHMSPSHHSSPRPSLRASHGNEYGQARFERSGPGKFNASLRSTPGRSGLQHGVRQATGTECQVEDGPARAVGNAAARQEQQHIPGRRLRDSSSSSASSEALDSRGEHCQICSCVNVQCHEPCTAIRGLIALKRTYQTA